MWASEAKRGGFVKKAQLYASHILAGGQMEYDGICGSLEARGEILIETIDGKWRPNSKITLVDTKG